MAATLTWNNGGANMQWDTSTANWTGSTWNNATPDDAVFSTNGAGTVTLTEPITAGSVTIGADGQDFGYVIKSNTLTVTSQLITWENLDIYSDIIMTGGELTLPSNRGGYNLYGDLYLNADGVMIDPNHINGVINIRGNLNGSASSVTLGRGSTRIHASATVNYGGKFRLHRSGAGNTMLKIGEGVNLTNDIVIASSGQDNTPRIISLISGSTNGTFSGNIDVSEEDFDGMFQIRADAGEIITVSGVISSDADGTGVDITGGGTVLLTGINTYNDPTTVRAVTLGGNGTIAGTATFTNSAIHSPGVDNVGVQTFSNLNYEAGSTLLWQLGTNSAASRGADFPGIDVNGDLDFDATTTLELVFTNGSSTVDWSDSFWSIGHTWLLWHVAGTTTDFNDLTLTTNNWKDAQSDLFDTVRSNHFFSIIQSGNDVYIKYAPPPSGSIFYIW